MFLSKLKQIAGIGTRNLNELHHIIRNIGINGNRIKTRSNIFMCEQFS